MITLEDFAYEQVAETIDRISGVFSPALHHELAGEPADMVGRVLADFVAAGFLRELDLRDHLHYVRTDVACAVREPLMTVYRCWDERRRLLYIGCTSKSVRERAGQHSRAQDWWPQVRRISEEIVVGWRRGWAVEAAAIRAERPLHNVMGAIAATTA